jgi:hypothetical protein
MRGSDADRNGVLRRWVLYRSEVRLVFLLLSKAEVALVGYSSSAWLCGARKAVRAVEEATRASYDAFMVRLPREYGTTVGEFREALSSMAHGIQSVGGGQRQVMYGYF